MSALRLKFPQQFPSKLIAASVLLLLAGCASGPSQPGYKMRWSTLPEAEFASPAETSAETFSMSPIDVESETMQPVLVSEVRPDMKPALPPFDIFAPAFMSTVQKDPNIKELDGAMLENADPTEKEVVLKVEKGIVSHYGKKWRGKTANGERFNPETMTAAHKSLPFGTIVRVTRLDTLASVVVRINNRGPYIKGRIIDLSQLPARMLGLMDKGIAPCRVEVLEYPKSNR